jgi:hypothetical protein
MTPAEAMANAKTLITLALYEEDVNVSMLSREDALEIIGGLGGVTAALIRAFAADGGDDPFEVWQAVAPTLTPNNPDDPPQESA